MTVLPLLLIKLEMEARNEASPGPMLCRAAACTAMNGSTTPLEKD